jgi:aspartate/methionine/tyrosine aminotransferase
MAAAMAFPVRRAIAEVPSSKIREVATLGMGMNGIIPLWFGEPNVPTPAFINQAAIRALNEGKTFYTLNRGIPELRQALADYMTRLHGRPIAVDRVTVTASAMNAIMIVAQSLIDPGDNAVLTAPLWPNIASCIAVMGGEARQVPLDEREGRWSLDLDRLFAAVDGRTRFIFVNSPANPTGWMMSSADQRAVLEFARARGIWIVADEVYDRIVFDRPHAPSFLDIVAPDDFVIRLNSFSKSWCMTGWRLGWITAPPAFGPVLEKMNEFNIANAASMAQYAGIVALTDGEAFIRETVARYERARDLVFQRLAAMPRVTIARPDAAFYVFFGVDGMDDSLVFAKQLLTDGRVGLAPGAAFGPKGEGHLRLCYAATLETLSEAMDRIAPLLK